MNTTTNPSYTLSVIDNLFFQLFSVYPTKQGQSYELLVGAVLKILDDEKKIIWDERKTGNYDKNSYQIDVGIYNVDSDSIMVEAKDHTKQNIKYAKVKRPELDKVAGSLIELNFDSGYFFSATDYTRDAKKKSIGSEINPNSKKISLFHLRPSSDADKKGRVETFDVTISSYELDPEKTIFNPSIPDEYFDKWQKSGLPTKMKSATEFDYNDSGIHCKGYLYDDSNNYIGEYEFYKALDKSIYNSAKENDFTIDGVWDITGGFIKINGDNIKIDKVQYKVAFKEISVNFQIKPEGNPALLVQAEDGSVNKLITDNQLKGITFTDSGEIEFNGAKP